MPKLSEQLAQKEIGERPTRTERVGEKQRFEKLKKEEKEKEAQEEFEKQKRLEAIEIISQADYENYEEKYKSIDPKYREGILTPIELKETSGYRDYQEEKRKQKEINQWTPSFDAYDRRNRPFALGLNPDQEDLRKFQEVKKAMQGKPSTVPPHVLSALRGGIRTDFGYSPKVWGLDVGETRTITTRDKATGEIKKQEVFKKVIDPETKKPVIMFGRITGEEIQKQQEEALKKQRDAQFKTFQKEQASKPKIIPFKIIPAKDLPFGYGGQQTISDQPISSLISEKDYYRDPKKLDLGIVSDTWKGIKSGFKWIDERVHFDLKLVGTSIPKLDIITFGKLEKPTKVEAFIEAKGEEKLGGISKKIEELAVGKENIGILETKYQEKYDVAFEQKYMKKLIYEEITFEKAVKEFEQSEETKILQKKYAIDYKQLQTDIPFWKKTSLGVAQTGISLTAFGLKAVKTPIRLITTAGAVYGGVRVLGAIPKSVSYGASTGLFAYGTYKFLSPTSTYVESGGGLITALVSGAFLGHGVYKHLRSPVIKTLKIKPPKVSLKASEIIGKDLKIITKKGTIQKVIFESQKLSQQVITGRRTIVTTKGRLLLEKATKIKIDPIYKGVPTQQLGKEMVKPLSSLREYSTYRTPSAYQKTLKRLIDYKYTPAQARATLRYYSPRVIEQYLKKGIISIKGKKAIGEFIYLKKQPVFDVDKALGIKTRGARTIKDIYKVERKLVDLGKKSFVLGEKTRLSLYLKRGASPFDFKEMDLTREIIFGKATGLKKGYELKDLIRAGKVDLKVFEKVKYRDLYGVSISKRMLPSDKVIRIDDVRTKLILKTIDIRKLTKPFGIKKTPFAKTFDTTEQVKKIIRQSQKSSTINVEKVIAKLEQTPTKARSQFYGTGQYERTVGGLDLQQGLKAGVLPKQVKVTALKDLIKIRQLDTLTGINLAQLSTVGLITKTKTATKLKTDLLLKVDLKSLLKTKSLLKQVQIPALKQQPVLKQALKLKLGLKTITPTITTFTLKTPTIPTIRPPTYTPPIIPPFLLKGRVEKKLLKKKKVGQEFVYLPDFTARALGLDPEIITGKQAQAKIKKILTGLEIRRGVIIR